MDKCKSSKVCITFALLLVLVLVLCFWVGNFNNQDKSVEVIDDGLFALKASCSEKANEFASRRSADAGLIVEKWVIQRNIWNTELQSCFSEFTIFSSSADGATWSNRNAIYDVLSEELIVSIVWLDHTYRTGSSTVLEWQQNMSEKGLQYEEKSKKIFGTSSQLPI